MPISKQAIKKMRHDSAVTVRNKKTKETIKQAVKLLRKSPTQKAMDHVFSLLDKAAKGKFFHKNKASRMKSRLSKLLVKAK